MTASEPINYEDLENTDVISVELVPERKGLILKHCEYFVSSRRHGTTVTRRYNEFVQLYDVLFAKYPYRAVSRLPPKRVVVGGGSPHFLQRRRAALQRWLTLAARHPVLAHDADLRAFLCEGTLKLERPKHDEFALAGTGATEHSDHSASVGGMEEAVSSEQEQLRLVYLGLGRLFQILEKVEARCASGRADVRELGAALQALSPHAPGDCARWGPLRDAVRTAANLATNISDAPEESEDASATLLLSIDALDAHRALSTRLARGLHAERARAAAGAGQHATEAARRLRDRHRYALACQLEEARVARAYSLAALRSLPALFRAHAAAHAQLAALWARLHNHIDTRGT